MKTSILSACLAFCAWTSAHAIVYRWPLGSASDMTSTFGPRNLAPSWFHAGVDLANLGYFMAPFALRITAIERTLGNDNYIDFVPTESRSDAVYDLTHMRFRHIQIPSDWVVGQTFPSGALMSTLLAGPNHLDMKGWYYSQYDEKLTSHPLKWFAYDLNAEKNTTLSITNGLQVDANGAHVKVTVTQPRNALSQNILEWAFGEYFSASGSYTTGDYMSINNADRYYISYEKRINVNDEKLSGSTFTPFMHNGIKIEPASGVNPKTTVFKIYCKKTPKVVEFRLKDPKGAVFKTANDLNFASCVGCTPPAGAPRPPSSITATQQANGVKVTWNLSPDHYGTQSTAYIIYRRPSSSGPLDAVPIGTVLGDNAQFIDTKYDQAEKRANLSYQYSVAAINPRGEGCTGPLVNQSCTPPAGKTCLEYCGAPLEKTMTMPGALSYYQPFHYGTTNHSMANPSWWGFTLGNNFLIDSYEKNQGNESYSPYSTYLYTTGPGSGSAVSELITPEFTAANRNEAGLTFSWTMKFPDNLPTYLKATNLLAVSLLNSSNQFLYSMTYTPTGLYDPWSGYDIELSKNNTTGTTVLRQALTSTDTPGWKWIKFKMTIDKTTAAGGDGMIRVFYDIGNGWGFKEYIAYKDEQHTQFSKLYFAYLTGPQGGGSHCSVKFDNIKLEQGLNLAQSP